MHRDFRQELKSYKCWDAFTDWMYRSVGVPEDCILQNREELIGLCEFIHEHEVRSFLEVGIWTGRLTRALHEVFRFDKVAACDIGLAEKYGLKIELPAEAEFFRGSSQTREYEEWRRSFGPVDLVFLDAEHTAEALRRDFEINRDLPHRFLAFHDITSGLYGTTEVRDFWQSLSGNKLEIVRPHPEVGARESRMGIGIWWG
ncbi:MAG: hypothetical protein HY319_21545 [Armatimonadetes bacterium]|nr:hypothetical protein [Armatimonadota bacterium]